MNNISDEYHENSGLHKHYLITGGAGFIGVNLVRVLLPVAHGIRILDNLSSGRAEDLKGLPVDFRIGDIRDSQFVEDMTNGVEVVIHLAAHTGVVPSVADPSFDMCFLVRCCCTLMVAV